ncbi:MAG TPA: tetratricopeptide repeat protein, partial [Edaphobacter sp.]|nr:tetratricopeptide repeat protein [Edaphobacter sp.]
LTKDQEYFSEGLSEQLIVDLAKVSGLKVIGRSSSFHFKGSDEDARDVGRKLGVANILEGSVRREGNHVRITAELIKADDDTQLWSQKYDRNIKDIFTLEDEIAQSATKALQVKLLGGNSQPIAPDLRSVDPEAYQAYLQAMHFSRIGQVEDLDKALAFADKAIKLDGKYAAAWALRAHVQNSIAAISITDPSENFREARDDAERAVALDPNLASAYLALATTQLLYGWDWDAANTLIAKAEILEPGSDEVLRSRARLLRTLGNLDEAIKLYEQAITLDPLRPHSYVGLGYLQYTAGRYEEARSTLRKYLDLNPHAAYAHLTLCKILIAEGKAQEAFAEIEKEPSTSAGKPSGEALAYHSLGRKKDSNAVLNEIISKHAVVDAYEIAQIYAYRGESDKSFEWLERAYRQRDAGLPLLDTDPLFKSLHRDSRYIELLRRMHLTVLQ